MNSNKASTSNILKFFKPSKRAVFFVLLAVLVLGFSVKVSLAAPPVPTPGTSFSNNPEWQKVAQSYTGTGKEYVQGYLKDGTIPTSPNKYVWFLQNVGGYSWADANKAGINNTSSFVPDPAMNTSQFKQTNTSDDTYISKWKAGESATAASNTDQTWLNRTFDPNGTLGLQKLDNLVLGGTPSEVRAKAADAVGSAALGVVITVLGVIATFCKTLLMWSGQALDVMLNPSLYNFTSNQMVVGGWIIVRDVCNLFFLLVLLFIAICTILKIEKYHAKKTLLMLIIMALLINFSKPIAVFIFDGSQLLMNMFLSELTKNGGSPAAKLAADIAEFLYKDLMTNLVSQGNSWEIAVYYLFVIVFLFMFAVALFVMFLFMMIRIVAVMILVIVSPLAFFAAIVPDFSKMSSQWWSSLFEYSYYGPAAAFFLFLATKFAIADKNSKILPQINIQGDAQLVIQHIVRYVVVLVFLYASIFMAKKFGGVAGAAIVKNADRVMKWGARMGGTGLLAAGTLGQYWRARDAAKGTLSGISQRSGMSWLTKESREKKSKERQARAEERFAPFSMATARKKAKEEEFKDQAKVDAGIARGSAHDLLIGSKRGTLTPEQLENSKVQKLIASSPELRKEILGNLRDKGQSHTAAYLRSLTPEKDDIEKNKTLEAFGKEEIYNNKKLGDMDWDKVINFKHDGKQPFEQILVDRLENIAQTNAQGFLNIASNLDGTKQDILRDNPKFQAVLGSAQKNAQNRNTGSQPNTGSQTGGYQSGGYGP